MSSTTTGAQVRCLGVNSQDGWLYGRRVYRAGYGDFLILAITLPVYFHHRLRSLDATFHDEKGTRSSARRKLVGLKADLPRRDHRLRNTHLQLSVVECIRFMDAETAALSLVHQFAVPRVHSTRPSFEAPGRGLVGCVHS